MSCLCALRVIVTEQLLCLAQTVHTTITNFPTSRCLLPAPAWWEPLAVHERYASETHVILETLQPQSITAGGDGPQEEEEQDPISEDQTSEDADSAADDSSSDESDADLPADKMQRKSTPVHRCATDFGYDCPAECYDPAFYLPVLQHVLTNRYVARHCW